MQHMSFDPFRKSLFPYVAEIGIDEATFHAEYMKLSEDERAILRANRRVRLQEIEEQAWRKYWKDHFDSVKKTKANHRRSQLPTLVNETDDGNESDPDEWVTKALEQEVDRERNYGRAQKMHWYRDLFFYLKEYLIRKYYTDIPQQKVHAFAERLLSEGVERTGIGSKEYMLEQIVVMDRKIKNDLLRWYEEMNIAHMYKPHRPYENVANYVVLSETLDWNEILPLLGKTDVDSLSGGTCEQESRLLHVLENMGKEYSVATLHSNSTCMSDFQRRSSFSRKRDGGRRIKKPNKKSTRRQ
jgi:hypothetical protein